MAIGPTLELTPIVDRTAIGELEAKIDAWLRNEWAPESDRYLLPFWVFWGANHKAFVEMLERYRAIGWRSVEVHTDSENTRRLVFQR
jgi:hypothetical protein